jgi:cell division cycle 20-like protein 1 (cofactor of APC complex)
VNKCKLLRVLKGHEGRVGALAWGSNTLSSGSKDKSILQRDLREKDDYFANLIYHKQEVCGLKWSYDEQQLASGGNDNKLNVWSVHNNNEPSGKFGSHLAAVKAISWSPH